MEELVRMAQLGEPLQVPAVVDGVATEVLNEVDYAISLPRGVRPKSPELRSETVIVIMNHIGLIEMLMDTVTS
jgi:homeobox-leucine zipper protein